MNPERWERVQDLFEHASALPEEERGAFLLAGCAGDTGLLDEVLALLGAGSRTGGFLERPVLEMSREISLALAEGEALPDAMLGSQVGAYTVVRRLGTGGMGVVYLAQQRSPRRVVALKLIRPGIASASVLRRFEHEAQILGRLHHPGIAQIFEAGAAQTPQGLQPFFAMEHVVGRPLLDYASAHFLGLRERAGLLIRICDALQHAHSKGVIHRDIKPGNILVEEPAPESEPAPTGTGLGMGQPKILDFGVARVTSDADATEAVERTEAGQIIGTLAYMSPEQLALPGAADAVDTRSDVYALGVLAYQLLAGRLPFEVAGKPLHEAARIICETEPVRPGSIERPLRGDLETIILKAMSKDPARRYQSAAAMGEDLRRTLADQPILARPASAAYQARKMIARHRAAFAGLVGFFVLVVAFAGWMSVLYANAERMRLDTERAWGAEAKARSEAEEAERVALRRAETATRVVSVLSDAFRSVDPSASASADINARDLIAREIIDRGIRNIAAELGDEPRVRAQLQHSLGSTCEGLGEYDRALSLYTEAIATWRGLEPEPDVTLGRYLYSLGTCLRQMGRYAEAGDAQREALACFRKHLPEDSPYVVAAIDSLAMIYAGEGRLDEAEALLTRAAELHERTPGHGRELRLDSLNQLAGTLVDRGDYEQAGAILERCMELRGNASDVFQTSYRLNRGWIRCMTGRYEEAEEDVRWAIEKRAKELPDGHVRTTPGMLTLGIILTRTGRHDEALPLLERCLAIRRERTPAQSARIGEAESALGECLSERGELLRAEQHLQAGLRAIQLNGDLTLETAQLALSRLGTFYEKVGKPEMAAQYRALLRRPWGSEPAR